MFFLFGRGNVLSVSPEVLLCGMLCMLSASPESLLCALRSMLYETPEVLGSFFLHAKSHQTNKSCILIFSLFFLKGRRRQSFGHGSWLAAKAPRRIPPTATRKRICAPSAKKSACNRV